MLEQLRKKRQERLSQHDLGGVYDDIAKELREVIDIERTELERLEGDTYVFRLIDGCV